MKGDLTCALCPYLPKIMWLLELNTSLSGHSVSPPLGIMLEVMLEVMEDLPSSSLNHVELADLLPVTMLVLFPGLSNFIY